MKGHTGNGPLTHIFEEHALVVGAEGEREGDAALRTERPLPSHVGRRPQVMQGACRQHKAKRQSAIKKTLD